MRTRLLELAALASVLAASATACGGTPEETVGADDAAFTVQIPESDVIGVVPASASASAFLHVRVGDDERAFDQGTNPHGSSDFLGRLPNIDGDSDWFAWGDLAYAAYAEPGATIAPSEMIRPFAAGSEAARLCMAKASRQLVSYLVYPSRQLLEVRRRLGLRKLALHRWNNDYTGASADGVGERRRLAYDASAEPKSITFISETNRDGTCLIPSRDAFDAVAKEWLAAITAAQ